MLRKLLLAAFASAALLGSTSNARADVVAGGFFSGTLEKFTSGGAQSTFSTIASMADPFPGISGVTFDPVNNRVYATARISDRIYSVNATSGAVLGFHQLAVGSQPAGIVTNAAGDIFVANNGMNSISWFNSSFGHIADITIPDIGLGNNLPSGLAFDSQGRLVVSTFAGGGVFRYDFGTSTFSSFAPSPLANGHIAIDASDNAYVGGAAFSNAVEKFNSAGTPIGAPFLNIDSTILPQPPLGYASPDFTSPAGVAIDPDGNLIVAALGRTNPFSASDNFQNNGGLFKFSPTGTLLQTFAVQSTPFSSVTFVSAIPEPSSIAIILTGAVATAAARHRKRKRLSTHS